jgi:hypothetical protein
MHHPQLRYTRLLWCASQTIQVPIPALTPVKSEWIPRISVDQRAPSTTNRLLSRLNHSVENPPPRCNRTNLVTSTIQNGLPSRCRVSTGLNIQDIHLFESRRPTSPQTCAPAFISPSFFPDLIHPAQDHLISPTSERHSSVTGNTTYHHSLFKV